MKTLLRNFLYKYGYSNSILQKVWIQVCKPFEHRKKERRINSILNTGNELLLLIKEITQQTGILIWPEFGTLLGAFREKSFISFDPDIDLGIMAKDYTPELINIFRDKGCSIHRRMYMINNKLKEKRLIEVTLKYKGILFDLFISDDAPSDKRKVYVSYKIFDEILRKFKVKYYLVDYTDQLQKIYINNIELYYPGNPYIYLKSIYGDSFMTPVKNWIPPKSNPIMTFLNQDETYVVEQK